MHSRIRPPWGEILAIRQYLESPPVRAGDNPTLEELRRLAAAFRIQEVRRLVEGGRSAEGVEIFVNSRER